MIFEKNPMEMDREELIHNLCDEHGDEMDEIKGLSKKELRDRLIYYLEEQEADLFPNGYDWDEGNEDHF